METIFKFIVRHFIFVLTSFVAVYLISLTFGALPNYFIWAIEIKILFGIVCHFLAGVMHGFWYENH